MSSPYAAALSNLSTRRSADAADAASLARLRRATLRAYSAAEVLRPLTSRAPMAALLGPQGAGAFGALAGPAAGRAAIAIACARGPDALAKALRKSAPDEDGELRDIAVWKTATIAALAEPAGELAYTPLDNAVLQLQHCALPPPPDGGPLRTLHLPLAFLEPPVVGNGPLTNRDVRADHVMERNGSGDDASDGAKHRPPQDDFRAPVPEPACQALKESIPVKVAQDMASEKVEEPEYLNKTSHLSKGPLTSAQIDTPMLLFNSGSSGSPKKSTDACATAQNPTENMDRSGLHPDAVAKSEQGMLASETSQQLAKATETDSDFLEKANMSSPSARLQGAASSDGLVRDMVKGAVTMRLDHNLHGDQATSVLNDVPSSQLRPGTNVGLEILRERLPVVGSEDLVIMDHFAENHTRGTADQSDNKVLRRAPIDEARADQATTELASKSDEQTGPEFRADAKSALVLAVPKSGSSNATSAYVSLHQLSPCNTVDDPTSGAHLRVSSHQIPQLEPNNQGPSILCTESSNLGTLENDKSTNYGGDSLAVDDQNNIDVGACVEHVVSRISRDQISADKPSGLGRVKIDSCSGAGIPGSLDDKLTGQSPKCTGLGDHGGSASSKQLSTGKHVAYSPDMSLKVDTVQIRFEARHEGLVNGNEPAMEKDLASENSSSIRQANGIASDKSYPPDGKSNNIGGRVCDTVDGNVAEMTSLPVVHGLTSIPTYGGGMNGPASVERLSSAAIAGCATHIPQEKPFENGRSRDLNCDLKIQGDATCRIEPEGIPKVDANAPSGDSDCPFRSPAQASAHISIAECATKPLGESLPDSKTEKLAKELKLVAKIETCSDTLQRSRTTAISEGSMMDDSKTEVLNRVSEVEFADCSLVEQSKRETLEKLVVPSVPDATTKTLDDVRTCAAEAHGALTDTIGKSGNSSDCIRIADSHTEQRQTDIKDQSIISACEDKLKELGDVRSVSPATRGLVGTSSGACAADPLVASDSPDENMTSSKDGLSEKRQNRSEKQVAHAPSSANSVHRISTLLPVGRVSDGHLVICDPLLGNISGKTTARDVKLHLPNVVDVDTSLAVHLVRSSHSNDPCIPELAAKTPKSSIEVEESACGDMQKLNPRHPDNELSVLLKSSQINGCHVASTEQNLHSQHMSSMNGILFSSSLMPWYVRLGIASAFDELRIRPCSTFPISMRQRMAEDDARVRQEEGTRSPMRDPSRAKNDDGDTSKKRKGSSVAFKAAMRKQELSRACSRDERAALAYAKILAPQDDKVDSLRDSSDERKIQTVIAEKRQQRLKTQRPRVSHIPSTPSNAAPRRSSGSSRTRKEHGSKALEGPGLPYLHPSSVERLDPDDSNEVTGDDCHESDLEILLTAPLQQRRGIVHISERVGKARDGLISGKDPNLSSSGVAAPRTLKIRKLSRSHASVADVNGHGGSDHRAISLSRSRPSSVSHRARRKTSLVGKVVFSSSEESSESQDSSEVWNEGSDRPNKSARCTRSASESKGILGVDQDSLQTERNCGHIMESSPKKLRHSSDSPVMGDASGEVAPALRPSPLKSDAHAPDSEGSSSPLLCTDDDEGDEDYVFGNFPKRSKHVLLSGIEKNSSLFEEEIQEDSEIDVDEMKVSRPKIRKESSSGGKPALASGNLQRDGKPSDGRVAKPRARGRGRPRKVAAVVDEIPDPSREVGRRETPATFAVHATRQSTVGDISPSSGHRVSTEVLSPSALNSSKTSLTGSSQTSALGLVMRICGSFYSQVPLSVREKLLAWAEDTKPDKTATLGGTELIELELATEQRECRECPPEIPGTKAICEDSVLVRLTAKGWQRLRRSRHVRNRIPKV
jgi:hypothetical protein